jgi:NTE family protein
VTSADSSRAGPVAVVLAGGAARGAFEAGALSVILPELERRGERPTLYVGTSVGAINASGLASRQHLSAEQQTAELVEIWQRLTMDQVVRSLVLRTGPLDALRLIGQLVPSSRVRLAGLLDPSPLVHNLGVWADWERLHANIASGAVSALAIPATSVRTGRTVVFIEARVEPRLHRSHAIAYVPATLDTSHVAASAAIPVVFPAVHVATPARARGW